MIPKYLVRTLRRATAAQPGQFEPAVLLVANFASDVSRSYTSFQLWRAVWGPTEYPEAQTDGVTTSVLGTRDVEIWLVDLQECAAGPAFSNPVATPGTPPAPVPRAGDLLQHPDGTLWIIQSVSSASRHEVFNCKVKQRP